MNEELEKLKSLLVDIRPDMQSRLEGFQQTWPAREVLTAVHRHEDFIRRIDKAIKELTP